jgi:hypothetical protein
MHHDPTDTVKIAILSEHSHQSSAGRDEATGNGYEMAVRRSPLRAFTLGKQIGDDEMFAFQALQLDELAARTERATRTGHEDRRLPSWRSMASINEVFQANFPFNTVRIDVSMYYPANTAVLLMDDFVVEEAG